MPLPFIGKEPDFEAQRKSRVKALRSLGYLKSKRVEAAMLAVPREDFVPDNVRARAYEDSPQPIGRGQTISAPHMVAIMAEVMKAEPGMKVLEVGGGCGYHAAVIAEMVAPDGLVVSLEIVPDLVKMAQDSLKRTGYDELVQMHLGDGSMGYEDEAPYDRIWVACAAPDVPPPLVQQLADGGKLIIPVESGWAQDLLMIERKDGKIKATSHGGCVFVPMKGKWGYD